jgi:hypothetical protein
MKKASALGVALSLFACSPGPAETGPASGARPNDGPSGPVRSAILTSGVTDAKIVVKATSPVDQFVTLYDPRTDSDRVIPCASTADCAVYPGSHCAVGGLCAIADLQSKIFYVQNVPVPVSRTVSFPIPCDGKTYVAEIFSATRSGSVLQIADAFRASDIVVDPACVAGTPTWGPIAQPSLGIPTVFENLPAPYNTFSVSVDGLGYPWSHSFSMSDNGVAPSSYYAIGAVFPSPVTAATQNFVGTFGLDPSILLSGEGTWQLLVTGTAIPVPTTPVSGP